MSEANDLTVGNMALVAQQEREAISRRTKEALAAAKLRGLKLGNPNGAAAPRRAGKGGASLRAAGSRNADEFSLRRFSQSFSTAMRHLSVHQISKPILSSR